MVHLPVRIGQQDGQGQIVIEDKLIQINPIDIRHPDADIVFGNLSELSWRTDNLPVENPAINSRLTPEDNEQRFLCSLCKLPGLSKICQPREPFPLGPNEGRNTQDAQEQ